MEITTLKSGAQFTLLLNGRLDASWCQHVQTALDDAIRAGEHLLQLDMAAVNYVSSAGLRVLLTTYKQLNKINGQLGVINASALVRDVLELAGLSSLLIATASASEAQATETSSTHHTTAAEFEVFPTPSGAGPVHVSMIGESAALVAGVDSHPVQSTRFDANSFALGIGALGSDSSESATRLGELLAVAGLAAYQPGDGSNRPDFMISEGELVPEGQLLLGLSGSSLPHTLARFEATSDHRTVGLTELATTALQLSQAPAAVVVALTETAGLVGTSLRQSPAEAAARSTRFGFPGVRDWLSFSNERTHRDSTTLVVGVVAHPGTSLDPLLRPLAPAAEVIGHFHAAAFPYRPLRKGHLDLKAAASELFDGFALQSVLHLLSDPREFNGAGESEFYRGAMWFAPVTL